MYQSRRRLDEDLLAMALGAAPFPGEPAARRTPDDDWDEHEDEEDDDDRDEDEDTEQDDDDPDLPDELEF
jgi:hypothetical protein